MKEQDHKEKKHESKEKKCECKQTMENLKKQSEEYLEGWKRSQADYLNLKRRVEEDLKRVARFANEDLILKVLPVMDNFRRATNHLPEEFKDNEWISGIKQIEAQLEETLKQEGLEKLEVLGKEFDPQSAEAMGFEASDKYKDGEVCEVLENGYRLNDKVIRPARVKICKK